MYWWYWYMLETYPSYMVYGCYGSLLEAHLCDIDIGMRHIFLVLSWGTSLMLWYFILEYLMVHDLWHDWDISWVIWYMVKVHILAYGTYFGYLMLGVHFDVCSMWVDLVVDDDVLVPVIVTDTMTMTVTYIVKVTVAMTYTVTMPVWLSVSMVVTGWFYNYLSGR